jgi:uncharacterized damage-inducible protein DinB
MNRSTIAEARVFAAWQGVQTALVTAISPLTPEQLTARPVAGQRTVAEIAAHIAFGRALWARKALGDAATTSVAAFIRWDSPERSPQDVASLIHGLTTTWDLYANVLQLGEPDDGLSAADAERLQILWGMLDHDLPHAGEISLLLGAQGLPGVEL